MTTEREVKLGVWPGFTLPDLSGVDANVRVERAPSERLEATYHDTADLALARWKITLRHRTGDSGGDRWTLKLPKDSTAQLLVRDEIDAVGDAKAVPVELRERVLPFVRTASLGPVAKLQTSRHRTLLRGADDVVLAEVVDDEVSVLDGRHVALRFREVEVEFTPAAPPSLVDAMVGRLRAAGAGAPDPTPKVMRALGPRALEPPDLVVPVVTDASTAADVLRAAITRAVLRIVQHDAVIRVGEDPEGVHQARVGTRRLRSDLRTFAPLLDPKWSEPLRAELSWFAGLLGDVRDADVLAEVVQADIASLDAADAAHGPELLSTLDARAQAARTALSRAMRSKRYVGLLDRLVDAAHAPQVRKEADKPAIVVLPELVAIPWSALAKAVKKAGRDPDDATLHAIRIRAKRARYAADVAALVVGKPATRFADAVAELQEILGDHQDAFVRRAWFRSIAPGLTPSAALVAGQLIARAELVAEDRRRAWTEAWKRADEGRLRTWLSR